MRVRVRLGSGLAQLAGSARLEVTLTEDATVADLLEHLRERHPDLGQKLDIALPMISGRYATHTDGLMSGQEVALLLPVSGGSK